MLSLQFKCSGSSPFEHCLSYVKGQHNSTGNETCKSWIKIETCDFPFTHYFGESGTYTLIIVIRNQVTTSVNQVAVNIYQGELQERTTTID